MDRQLMDILNQLDLIDYGKALLKGFMPLISYYSTNKVLSTIALHKDFKPKDISNVSLPPELKQRYTDVEISQISSKRVKVAVLDFANILIKEFPSNSLFNFYNNINEVKVKRNISILLLFATGTYTCEKNKIGIIRIASIYHELFHMASSVYNAEKQLGYSGFSQKYYKNGSRLLDINICYGINEGYTELLANRYFGAKHKMFKAYKFEVGIAEKLEIIVGQDEMKKLYLSANLMGLIESLKQYATEKDILNFITGVDLINNQFEQVFLFNNHKIKTSIINIYNFLIQAYIVKLKKQAENEIITIDEFVELSTKYIRSLGTSVRVYGYKYNYLTGDNLCNIFESINNIYNELANNKEISSSYKK